jgi:hypothetical protein
LRIFEIGGCADHANLAVRERGFKHVGRVHRRAYRRPGSDQVVQLIYEQNDKPVLTRLINESFKPFLVLTSKACTREQVSMAEGEYTHIL